MTRLHWRLNLSKLWILIKVRLCRVVSYFDNEVGTGSGSDRVSLSQISNVAEIRTRSLPLPVLTSSRRRSHKDRYKHLAPCGSEESRRPFHISGASRKKIGSTDKDHCRMQELSLAVVNSNRHQLTFRAAHANRLIRHPVGRRRGVCWHVDSMKSARRLIRV